MVDEEQRQRLDALEPARVGPGRYAGGGSESVGGASACSVRGAEAVRGADRGEGEDFLEVRVVDV